ncbi:alcohol-forming fatty acyl-CoA reductase-like [Gossypium australe]|uniref:Alcohol-forming fatty acyl-CoA reductase-like n=1 Tax=Gossypium australe TaxID=47621 RepID=A0A5B6X103_9ROSI|nr:alcohol-forming fatty acyl-CoA reductase-like [Gossypium australe]
MCKRFQDGLNEYIKLFVAILELKEFVVLVDQACKAEELVKEKTKVDMESRDLRKRQWSKSFQSSSKKRKSKQYSGNKAQTTPVASVGNIRPNRPECPDVTSVSVVHMRVLVLSAVPKITSLDNALKWLRKAKFRVQDQEALIEEDNQGIREVGRVVRAARPEGRAPARAYAIRAREEASSPDCNPLGKSVLVNKVCKDYPLMIRGHYFKANLMLLPFDEFDIILGMD